MCIKSGRVSVIFNVKLAALESKSAAPTLVVSQQQRQRREVSRANELNE